MLGCWPAYSFLCAFCRLAAVFDPAPRGFVPSKTMANMGAAGATWVFPLVSWLRAPRSTRCCARVHRDRARGARIRHTLGRHVPSAVARHYAEPLPRRGRAPPSPVLVLRHPVTSLRSLSPATRARAGTFSISSFPGQPHRRAARGVINKFLGDGFHGAVWRHAAVPQREHARQAALAALALSGGWMISAAPGTGPNCASASA